MPISVLLEQMGQMFQADQRMLHSFIEIRCTLLVDGTASKLQHSLIFLHWTCTLIAGNNYHAVHELCVPIVVSFIRTTCIFLVGVTMTTYPSVIFSVMTS
jgi:hypothetical protein